MQLRDALKTFSFVLLPVFSVGSLAHAKAYQVDPSASEVSWVGKKVVGQHNGSVKLKSGELNIEKGQGVIEIDLTTIANEDLEGEWNQKLVDHLKSDDFFSVAKHPVAKYEIKKITPQKKQGLYTLSGQMTIKGITKPLEVPAKIVTAKDKVTLESDFSFDRTQWDVKYNSGKFFDPKALGDKMINDAIEIGVKVVAK